MATLIAAAALSTGASDLGVRIGEAAAAEQSMRGPLEGAWALRDVHGRVVLDLQISDPTTGAMGGAWRELATNDIGVIAGGSRRGDIVHIELIRHAGERAWLTLRPDGPARWRGRMLSGSGGTSVRLTRD